MSTARQDPAARRRRLDLRVSVLKRRFGIASILGFGTLFGLVTQHAVGTQKHASGTAAQAPTSARGASTFFDASGPGYSFDDSGVRVAQQNAAATASQAAQQQQQQQQQPAPVAQSSGS
jgi:hypothetical protein